ncbi:MAG: sensor domain-containing diguanylate cyclase [Myxococcales bacterium]|nr:sensor domain-containing diguanylate cyclase [Myxococcales bacterium]
MDAPAPPTPSGPSEVPVVEYRGEELAILFDTISDLTSTLCLREVIERLLDRVLVHLDSEIASILLTGPDGRLRIRHSCGLPEEVVASTCLGLGEDISGYVARVGSALLIEDIEQDSRFRRRNHERYYTRSAISVPLRIHGTVMGVINVNNKRNREAYTPDDLRLVEAIAGHAAVALFNAQRFEETLERAQHDALTGLANHGYFWSTLDREVERARRYERQLSVAMIDVDHFKRFNDRYGHVAGDEALAGIARVTREWSRVHDFASRYGGEEFALILPETGSEGSFAVAEKLREAVGAARFSHAEPGGLTVSVGVATFPQDAHTAGQLVEIADARLYQAKAGGRNRVCAGG